MRSSAGVFDSLVVVPQMDEMVARKHQRDATCLHGRVKNEAEMYPKTTSCCW